MENNDDNISPKNRTLALLLGIFLGPLGVHNFYLGRPVRGIFQLIIYFGAFLSFILGTLLGSGNSVYRILLLVFLMDSAMLWSIIEWIAIAAGKAKDGKGKKVLRWNEQ